MSVTDPRVLNEHYNDLFRKGDLEGLVALYEPDALLSPVPGQQLKGHDQIRKQLKGLLALTGELTATQQLCVVQNGLAMLHATWHFKGSDASGNPVEIGGNSSKLARQGKDGSWRYVIDLPVTFPVA